MATYSVALIPGDGIGPEILRAGRKVMDAAAKVAGITWQWKEYPFGAEHWLKHRKGLPTLMSQEDMADLGAHDAIYFGAVGEKTERYRDIPLGRWNDSFGGAALVRSPRYRKKENENQKIPGLGS